ncbi:hypothetical protein AVEN_266931-1 [Araneus ventricosus]|uniref:Uncharacterized protein n=1 Tax=Araneus ventricosus TaxID=182803 RepID=A0A4Y2DFN9_ARAVE|nr:hypothetical protein AVEN_266931-1 [Araneus ventricosus]
MLYTLWVTRTAPERLHYKDVHPTTADLKCTWLILVRSNRVSNPRYVDRAGQTLPPGKYVSDSKQRQATNLAEAKRKTDELQRSNPSKKRAPKETTVHQKNKNRRPAAGSFTARSSGVSNSKAF